MTASSRPGPAPSPAAPGPPAPARPPALARLGRFLVARRRPVLVATVLAVLAGGVVAAGTMNALSLSRFESPGSESVAASELLAERFGTNSPNLLLVVTAESGSVDDPAVAAAGEELTAELAARPEVAEAVSYWQADSPALRSQDGTKALVAAWLPGDVTEVRDRIGDLSAQFTRDTGVVTVGVGGQDEVFRQVAEQARDDFLFAEMIIFPAAFLFLLLVYRRATPALLTLGVGLFSMVTTLALLRGLTAATEVSTFAANLTLVLGLGLGIDYSLFVILRFREELARGRSVAEAVTRTVQTAGRTVIFSGVTVAVSLSVLLAFPFPFLRSFAYAGVLVVLTSVVGAVLVLPAALAVVGARVARRGGAARPVDAVERGFWYRTAGRVMRRPVLVGGAVLVVLLVAGSPFLGVRFGLPDERILPEGTSSREVHEQIGTEFAVELSDAVQVVAPEVSDPAGRLPEIEQYAVALSRLPGVFQVDSLAGSFAAGEQVRPPGPDAGRYADGQGTWLSVVPTSEVLESDPSGLVRAVRAAESPFPVQVGGYPADMTDYRDRLVERLPVVAGLILVVTFVILFLMSGSLVLPFKATVLNVLSLSVMFGALVWVFQEGNLAGLIGFTPTGGMEASIPILMFCVAYGLSMDYEVFMLSRIKEEYDRTGDNVRSVATGLQRSGPLVTAAALILAFAFATYATSGVGFLQMLGVCVALAILVDATLIRAVLVPAFMKLAGRANWWAPAPLRRLHDRFGVSEAEPEELPDGATVAAARAGAGGRGR